MDNYYTSPELFTELDLLETYAYGTLRVNRKEIPDAIKRKTKLAEIEVIYRRNGNLLAVKFHDKRQVHVTLSTFHEATMAVLNKKVYGKDQNVTKPTPIIDYIKHMGGVDLSDQFNQYNTVMRKTTKWWKLFFHLLSVCIANA